MERRERARGRLGEGSLFDSLIVLVIVLVLVLDQGMERREQHEDEDDLFRGVTSQARQRWKPRFERSLTL